jgi:hypothetical protein
VKKLFSMRQALADPMLLDDALPGASWASWRALLIAIMGEPLESDEERAAFKRLTGGRETEPGDMVELFLAVSGRRSGKSQSMATATVYLAMCCDWSEHLAIGEKPRALYLGPKQEQAGYAFDYAVGLIDHVKMFRRQVESRTADTITLKSGVILQIQAANACRIRGGTAISICLDECAYFPSSEESANRDEDLLTALRPSLATTGGPLFCITSPATMEGVVFNLHKRFFGPDGDRRVVVVQSDSLGLNPKLSREFVERQYEVDPTGAVGEWGGEFKVPVSAYLERPVIERAVAWGEGERGPIPGAKYLAFVDAAGGGGRDSFALAVGHVFADQGKKIAALDVLLETRPPFDADVVCARCAEVLRRYNLREVVGDKFGGDILVSFFRRHGIGYHPSAPSKSELYLYAAPRFMSGQISLLSQPRLVDQFCGLRRRILSAGREEVDHGRGQHDDCANAVAGLVWRLLPPEFGGALVTPMIVWSSGRVEGGEVIREPLPLSEKEQAAAERRKAAEAAAPIVSRPASERYSGIVGPEDDPMARGSARFDYPPTGNW